MNKTQHFVFFLFALLPTLFLPLFIIPIPFTTIPPYLIISLYKRSLSFAFSQAFFMGFVLDLLSSETPFGFWTLNFILTLYSIRMVKHLFYIEKLMSIPILTFFFSSTSTLLYVLMTHIFCSKTHLTIKWFLSDLVALPICDALFALIVFSLPLSAISRWLPSAKRTTTSINLNKS
ncbi:MAG: hypothetical protein S4CHLAM7_03910 [Chlamydiae bacterium]|nr:hypothetical protein [Chlamydiota bacterium]